jgi:hypothetical protein
LFVRGVPKGQSSLFIVRFLIEMNYPAYPGIMTPVPSEPKSQHKRNQPANHYDEHFRAAH